MERRHFLQVTGAAAALSFAQAFAGPAERAAASTSDPFELALLGTTYGEIVVTKATPGSSAVSTAIKRRFIPAFKTGAKIGSAWTSYPSDFWRSVPSGFPSGYSGKKRDPRWQGMVDAKFRKTATWGTVVVVACNSRAATYGAKKGLAAIIEMPSSGNLDLSDVRWMASPGGKPHGVELIPDLGVVVVASSHSKDETRTGKSCKAGGNQPDCGHSEDDVKSKKCAKRGGYLTVYIPEKSATKVYATVDFPGAHAVHWDPVTKLLWVGGWRRVRAYRVELKSAQPVFTAIHTFGRLEGGVDASGVKFNGYVHDIQPSFFTGTSTDAAEKSAQITKSRRVLYVADYYGARALNTATLKVGTTFHADTRDESNSNVIKFPGLKSFVRTSTGVYMWTRNGTVDPDKPWLSDVIHVSTSGKNVPPRNGKTATAISTRDRPIYRARMYTTRYNAG